MKEVISSGESSRASSKTSRASSKTSSVLALKKAALQAAKVKREYAAHEAAPQKKEQAHIVQEQMIAEAAHIRKKEELAADLDNLNQEKEVAAYAAETHALETASNPPESQGLESLPIDDPLERVEQFINTQKQDQNKDNNEIIEINTSTGSKSYHTVKQEIDPSVHESPMPIVKPKNEFSESRAAEFTKFFLRKDLTLPRLYSLNDKPESFRVWKSSFNEVVKEIGATPSEEID